MNTLRLAAVAALALSLVTPASAFIDTGGKVWSYAKHSRHSQRINWPCMSACTLALSNRSTCAGPEAVFVFHAVSNAGKHNRRLTQWLVNRYPASIRSWINSRGGLTSKALTLKGSELRRRVRSCA